MSAPTLPIPNANTAKYLTPAQLVNYENFYAVPYPIQGLATTVVHLAPNGNVTHLAGPNAGQEGSILAQMLQGEQQLPFEQVISESAFQWGATIERTNYPKRLINFRICIGGFPGCTTYQYQLADNRWWAGQDETTNGWLGVFTRFTGMRWIPVRPYKTVDTAQKQDPVAYGNNFAIWDVSWICEIPYYTRPSLYATWTAKNSPKTVSLEFLEGLHTGSITLANQGDMWSYVQYIINGSGTCQVQDNNSSTMVTLPPIFDSDGPCLVDTDPQNRTLTASNDPVDDLFYQYLQSSSVLSFLLSNVADQGEPWWQRGYVRFVYLVPPQTVVSFNVAHTNPDATVTVLLQQRYKRSR
jgi:hypothetical protein